MKTNFITVLVAFTLTSGLASAAILNPPTPTSPGDTASPGSLIATSLFTWSSVAGATGYGLYIRDLTTNTLIFNSNGAVNTGPAYTLPVGYLPAGHTFRWAATAINASGESVQSSYRYFQTGLPNLIPIQPANWSDKIVVSNLNTPVFPGAHTDAASLTTADPIYVYLAGANRGNADASNSYSDIYLDGVFTQVRLSHSSLNLASYWMTQFAPGHLGAGQHTVRIVVDSTGIVTENNENDNEYTKTFTITATGTEPQISSLSPNPVPGSTSPQTLTIYGSNFVNKPSVTLSWTGQPNYTVPAAQVTYVSATQLQMAITVDTTPDNWTVQVTNPDGQPSNRLGFQVVNNLPLSPTTLETQSFSDHVALGWTDNSTNETGFLIERSTGSGAFVQIGSAGGSSANAAFYTDNTTSRRTTYTYRVRAYNANGYSGYTNEVTATTPGGLPGTFTLSNDTAVWDASIPGPKVQLNWTASSDVGNYAVYRNGSVYQAGIAGTSYLNSANLTGGSTYTYFIRASNADGTTDSNTITVTMPNPVLAPEIAVESPLNTNIADGGSKSFGTVVVGANTSLTFTIKNIGTANLTGLTLTKDGTDAGLFTITSYPTAPVSGPSGSTTFTVKFAPTSAGSKVAAIHIASNDSDENPFDIMLTGAGNTVAISQITISGPTSLAAGNTATFTATGLFQDGSSQDISSFCQWIPVGSLPLGVSLAGNQLSAGQAVTSGVANFVARYSGTHGQLTSASVQVGVGGAWAALITSASASYVANSNPPKWLLNATAHSQGTLPEPSIWQWRLDGIPVGSPDGFVNNVLVTTTKGQHTLTLTVTDANGLPKTTPRFVAFDMPAANEPPSTRAPDDPQHLSTIYDLEGHSYTFQTARIATGFLLITHGLNDYAKNAWLSDMGTAIETRLTSAQRPLPNIALYDWADNANPHAARNWDINTRRIIESWASRVSSKFATLVGTVYDFQCIEPLATSQGVNLAAWLLRQIRAGNIDPSKPIHLIGHSAGGFVAGEAATYLKQAGYIVDLVTMLDTPDPIDRNFTELPNPGRVERYISSVLGIVRSFNKIGEHQVSVENWLADINVYRGLTDNANKWDPTDATSSLLLPTEYYVRQVFFPAYNDYKGDASKILDAHANGYYFYTIETISTYGGMLHSGFWNSPFLNGPNADRTFYPKSQVAPGAPSRSFAATPNESNSDTPQVLGGESVAPTGAIPNFQTFGPVTSITGGYQITEDGNAGIFAPMVFSYGAAKIRFKYWFSTPGDGDFLVARIGDSAAQYIGDDNELTEDGFVTAEFPLAAFANMTDTLIFTLTSRGNTNAIVQIKDIELIESDDPDGDSLMTSQELTIGTNPILYDTDADGIGDWEEVNTTLTNPLKSDSDGDGMGDAQEIIAGTSGVDASSVFRTTGTTVAANGAVMITWAAKAGKTYRVQRSDAPDFSNYTVVGDNISGVEPTTSFTDSSVPGGTPRMFYRVEVK